MTDDSTDGAGGLSRRDLLGTAMAVGAIATADCLDSVLGTAGPNENEIDPVAPNEPREGTAGEFYTLVERTDVPVASLREDEGDLETETGYRADLSVRPQDGDGCAGSDFPDPSRVAAVVCVGCGPNREGFGPGGSTAR
ncbi:hypothetical protein NP511_00225 [Natrinema thermotolerans]|uniref:Uncharacterized protein n=1 Tax=Natrinema thermotolerans TaxID=121872 RepID=A0AAF0PE06_9EURY|nr:hypothetical protein [Natrinema thermotolerans]QCC60417.1 hypothetical protein DVR14_17975 [Natrinema thermotolerans]QCC61323.1 hypothetical protein DVR14_22105 [Natrinema thermotolerans]WMT07445.1 hypothetical protein NP511_18940 [Natrinema thermotolerans]WMT08077.1 hypothetical protein NP511_00225 [Natrinema thermotolerans]